MPTGVAQLAVAIAQRLGLTATQTQEIQQAAEIHDLGKIATSDAILTKPAPPSTPEQAFVREHRGAVM